MGRALWAFLLISENAGTTFHTVRFGVHFHQLQIIMSFTIGKPSLETTARTVFKDP